jgi:hypothetical protein
MKSWCNDGDEIGRPPLLIWSRTWRIALGGSTLGTLGSCRVPQIVELLARFSRAFLSGRVVARMQGGDPMHELGWEKGLQQAGLLCCRGLVTYVGEIKEWGEPTATVCGCYLVHFSCSPTSTDWIHTWKNRVTLVNSRWNICKHRNENGIFLHSVMMIGSACLLIFKLDT